MTEDATDRGHHQLIAAAKAAALAEARLRFGQGDYRVTGATQRGCCVHLAVRHDGRLLARWRYELDGSIAEDARPPEHAANI